MFSPSCFRYAFGDWGKGGVNGDIRTVVSNMLNNDTMPLTPNDDYHRQSISHVEDLMEDKNKQAYTYQRAMAEAMNSHATLYPPSMICALGDNFYADGVASTTDTMWTTHWYNIYISPFETLKVPWYSVFGNHDYGSNLLSLYSSPNHPMRLTLLFSSISIVRLWNGRVTSAD